MSEKENPNQMKTGKKGQKNRKTRSGVVISDKMQKTIIVRVMRLAKHPRYNRILKKYTKFKAHDEANKAKVGSLVRIEETRPISKHKRWRLVEIVKT
jgi:small subunit ribosomal protein S17